jgi:hypothetical protein
LSSHYCKDGDKGVACWSTPSKILVFCRAVVAATAWMEVREISRCPVLIYSSETFLQVVNTCGPFDCETQTGMGIVLRERVESQRRTEDKRWE